MEYGREMHGNSCCTCGTNIFSFLTNNILALWRCHSRSRRLCLNSLLTCQGRAKKQRTFQVIVFALVSRYHTLRVGYKPLFTNISNLQLPFLISQNACFMSSHLRFTNLLEKALGLSLLFKTSITKQSVFFGHVFLRAIERLK